MVKKKILRKTPMKKILNWREKYSLALKEQLTIKEIMLLRDCGQPKAVKLREKAIEYCASHDIEFEYRKIPTQVIFEITNLNLDYYYNKMLLEARAV